MEARDHWGPQTEIPMAGLACFSTPGKPRAHPISPVGLTCDDFDAPWLLPHNLMSILLRGWELLVTLKLKKLSCQFCLSQGLVFDVLKSLTARRNGFSGSKLCGFRSFRSSLRLWAAELAFQSIHVASDMTRRGQGTEFVGCPKKTIVTLYKFKHYMWGNNETRTFDIMLVVSESCSGLWSAKQKNTHLLEQSKCAWTIGKLPKELANQKKFEAWLTVIVFLSRRHTRCFCQQHPTTALLRLLLWKVRIVMIVIWFARILLLVLPLWTADQSKSVEAFCDFHTNW